MRNELIIEPTQYLYICEEIVSINIYSYKNYGYCKNVKRFNSKTVSGSKKSRGEFARREITVNEVNGVKT